MIQRFRRRPPQIVVAVWAASCILAVGLLIGWFAAANRQTTEITLRGWEIPVAASASVASNSVAAATGPIDDRVEGLFTLDALSGRLQCVVLYTTGPQQGKFGAVYESSVFEDLNIEGTKKPNYLLLTGFAQMNRGRGGSGALQPASCVAYVIDGNTGNFAVYGVPWNPNLVARGTPQGGTLKLLDIGTARMEQIRE